MDALPVHGKSKFAAEFNCRLICKGEGLLGVILPKDRDPRFVTIRRGATVVDLDHQLLALWAAARPAPGGDSRARTRRPAVAKRHLLVGFRLLRARSRWRTWPGPEVAARPDPRRRSRARVFIEINEPTDPFSVPERPGFTTCK